MNKRIALCLIVLALLLVPMLCCDDTGYTEQDGVSVEQAEYTIKVNECSWKCDGIAACIAECVNR